MGALMVVDPQPAARYQPAEPYINRAAPKSKGLKKKTEGEREEEEKGRTRRQKQKNTEGDKNREINPEKEGITETQGKKESHE